MSAIDECWLRVPERHAKPDGPTLDLFYARVRGGAPPDVPPIVYLTGGPGIAASDRLRERPWLFETLAAVGDVIAFDQRGVGRSRPELTLPLAYDLPWDTALTREAFVDASRDLSRTAIATLQARSIDPGVYVTTESADDVGMLIDALGGRAILFGGSYGSHLGLAVIRRHRPKLVRALLFTVEGMDDTIKQPQQIDALLAELDLRLQQDPVWRDRLGSIPATLSSLLDRMCSAPIETTQDGRRIMLGPFDLQRAVARGVGSTQALRALPARLDAMSRGDWRWLAAEAAAQRSAPLGNVMSLTMDAASGISAVRRAAIREQARTSLLGDVIDLPLPDIDDVFEFAPLPDAFRAPVQSDLPIVFLSGTLDGRTPPANADAVLRGFPQGHHLVVDGASHDMTAALLDHPQLEVPIVSFLRTGSCDTQPVAIPFAFDRCKERDG